MSNVVKIDVKPVTPGIFSIKVVENSVAKGLRASDYVPFSENLEFAGLSIRDKPLSIPKSKGPANISGFLLKANDPVAGWVCINGCSDGVLIKTEKPIVQLSIMGHSGVAVFIQAGTLLDRYSLIDNYAVMDSQDDVIGEVEEPADAVYFLQTFPNSKIVQVCPDMNLVLPWETLVDAQDWRKLKRHVYTGEMSAPYCDTVPVGDETAVFFPGKTLQEVQDTYGIDGDPVAFNNGALGFSIFHIVDATKAGSFNAVLASLGGKHLEVRSPGFAQSSVRIEEFVKNPRLIEASESIVIDSGLNGVVVAQSESTISLLDYPLFNRDEREHPNEVICPEHLLDQFFFPVLEASRTCKVEDIVRYTIKYDSDKQAPGKWLLKSDMTKLKPWDRKQEFQSRKARQTSLESTYGKLPDGWHKLNDEELKLYFSIQQRLEAGEIVPYRESRFRANDGSYEDVMTDWLKEQKQMVTCPLSSQSYVPNYASIDEMVSIPGFWSMIKRMFGDTHLFHALITSPKVQAMVMTELI